ncbi:MAG TPA: choice-of-anchor V domain-containing protein [Saprospiraceae bacterium]|nr:choice-of-anchor V domain-containing protein [Saprospiraceae bacterium]
MKKPLLLTILALSILMIANSGGPGAITGRDRTGSPIASGSCNNCHIGGDYGTEVSVSLLQDSREVQEYIPGQAYTFKVKINTNNPAERYGFQAVALTDQNNDNAGVFGTPPAGTQITNLNGRAYFEHANKLQVDSMEIEWVAPEAGTGTVEFYAAGNAVNNASGSGGDDSDVLDVPLTVTESVASGLTAVRQLNLDWQIFPNPAREQVWIQVNGPQPAAGLQIRLLDARGLILQEQALDLFTNGQSISLGKITSGLYYLQLFNSEGVTTKRFLKLN